MTFGRCFHILLDWYMCVVFDSYIQASILRKFVLAFDQVSIHGKISQNFSTAERQNVVVFMT